jgi:hypothetical protein
VRDQKPQFAIDIDSILYSFETAAREAFLKLADETGDRDYLRGAYTSWVEWRSPADVCGIDIWMDVIQMCHQPEVILRQKPFPGAVETLQALHSEGFGLKYLSNRSPDAAAATREWLENSGFPIHAGVEVHCQMESKIPFLKECQYIIDDRPRTLVEFVHDPSWKGDHRWGLSLMYEYNRALTDLEDIFLSPTWSGLSAWLVRKGLLPESPHLPLES